MISTPLGDSEWFQGDVESLEVRTEQRVERVNLKCPKCSDGLLLNTGLVWQTTTPGHHHACNECGYLCAVRGKTYPCTITRNQEGIAEVELDLLKHVYLELTQARQHQVPFSSIQGLEDEYHETLWKILEKLRQKTVVSPLPIDPDGADLDLSLDLPNDR